MAKNQIYYVGTEAEVGHHAAPIQREIDVRIAGPSEVVNLAGPNDLAIFFSEHFHRFRDAWLQLSKKGCHTLYAIDGILEWRNAWENLDDEPACPWTMRPVLSDKVACIGASQARVLDAWGNHGKSEITGIPRFESLLSGTQSAPSSNQEGPFRVLVTTAKWPGFTPEQIQQATQSLLDLKQHFESHPQVNGRTIEPIWRLTGELDSAVGVQNQLCDISGKELAAILKEVDAVITTPSTVMLEVMLSGLPVCLLDYTNSPRYVDAAWSISARDQMAATIQQLATPTTRRMFLQKSILEDALQCTESSTKRLATLANAMIRIGHDCRAANQPVVFPANILPPAQGSSILDHNAAFPDLANVPINTDQAIAAESLRRVNHLDARIDLLESELAKAADGFDRIASHPILAPLVKVRKLAIGMGSRIAEILTMDRKEKNQVDSSVSAPSPKIGAKT